MATKFYKKLFYSTSILALSAFNPSHASADVVTLTAAGLESSSLTISQVILATTGGDATLSLPDAISFSSPINTGTISTIGSGITITNSGNVGVISVGSIAASSPAVNLGSIINTGTVVTISGGTTTGTATIDTLSGAFAILTGADTNILTLTNSGTITNTNTISGAINTMPAGTLTGSVVATTSSAMDIIATLSSSVNTVTLAPGAQINFGNGGSIVNTSNAPVIINPDLINNPSSGQVDVGAANTNSTPSYTSVNLGSIVSTGSGDNIIPFQLINV